MKDAHDRMSEVFEKNEPEPMYVPPTYEPKPIRLRRFEGPVQIRTH